MTSTTTATGPTTGSKGVRATWTRTRLRYLAVAEPMHCYRHPRRETYISCSECGRPICTECMTPAPVGQRCPEHSGKPQGVRRVPSGARLAAFEGTGAMV